MRTKIDMWFTPKLILECTPNYNFFTNHGDNENDQDNENHPDNKNEGIPSKQIHVQSER